jgi:hypothetical protein
VVDADLDGDDLRDRLFLYFERGSESIQHARAFLATGETGDAQLDGSDLVSPEFRTPEAVVDLDLDGGDEVVVIADLGASTMLESVLSWDGDRLVSVYATGGTLGGVRVHAPLIEGGGISHLASWGCVDETGDGVPELVQSGFQGSFDYPDRYGRFETVYEWREKTLVMVAERSGVAYGRWPSSTSDLWGSDVGRCGDDPPPMVEPLPPEPATPLDAARGLLDAWSTGDERLATAFTGLRTLGSGLPIAEDPIRDLFRFDADDYDLGSLECRITGVLKSSIGDRVETAYCLVSPRAGGLPLNLLLEAPSGGHYGFGSDAARPWWAVTSAALLFEVL